MAVTKKLPQVPETILKRRKQRAEIRQKIKAGKAKAAKRAEEKTGKIFKRAEKYVTEYRKRQQDHLRLKREAEKSGSIYVPEEAKLAFVIRIRGINQLHPRPRKVLQLLRLRQINNGVFVKLNKATIQMLRIAEPYIAWGYPSLKTVHDLVYKRGFAKVNHRRTPITSNDIVEESLGKQDIICMEDLVHEIYNVGENFKRATNFLWPFKLSNPNGGWAKKTNHFVEGAILAVSRGCFASECRTLRRGFTDDAVRLALQGPDIAEFDGSLLVEAYTMCATAYAEKARQERDHAAKLDARTNAIRMLKNIRERCAISRDTRAEAVACFEIAGLAQEIDARSDEAKKYLKKTIRLAEEHKDQMLRCDALSCLGNIYKAKGKQLILGYQAKMRLLLAERDRDKQAQRRTHASLGNIHLATGHTTDAIRSYRMALVIALELNDRLAMARHYEALAAACFQESDFDEARSYLKNWKALCRQIDYTAGEQNACQMLGDVQLAAGLHPSAAYFYALTQRLAKNSDEAAYNLAQDRLRELKQSGHLTVSEGRIVLDATFDDAPAAISLNGSFDSTDKKAPVISESKERKQRAVPQGDDFFTLLETSQQRLDDQRAEMPKFSPEDSFMTPATPAKRPTLLNRVKSVILTTPLSGSKNWLRRSLTALPRLEKAVKAPRPALEFDSPSRELLPDSEDIAGDYCSTADFDFEDPSASCRRKSVGSVGRSSFHNGRRSGAADGSS
ncbi:unnamed protein product, partial [Mesorhabditis spiculigera]